MRNDHVAAVVDFPLLLLLLFECDEDVLLLLLLLLLWVVFWNSVRLYSVRRLLSERTEYASWIWSTVYVVVVVVVDDDDDDDCGFDGLDLECDSREGPVPVLLLLLLEAFALSGWCRSSARWYAFLITLACDGSDWPSRCFGVIERIS